MRKHDIREYGIWTNIKTRCYNQNTRAYQNYGARGITLCAEWDASFDVFLAAVGPAPSRLHSLDRIDNDRGYEPGNMRWVTRAEQQRNTSRNRWITFNGETLVLMDWAKRLGVSHKTIAYRLTRGWSTEDALTLPPKLGRRIIIKMKMGRRPKSLGHPAEYVSLGPGPQG